MTETLSCTCEHVDQDKMYGKNIRLFNQTEKLSGSKPIFRCTVCKKEKSK